MVSSSQASKAFQDRYGEEASFGAIAPGRVNLIGEHTDYNDGFVFPAAIDREVIVAARLSHGRLSRFESLQLPEVGELDLAGVRPGGGSPSGWWDYAVGVAWALTEETGEPMPAIEVIVDSNVPMGSGISSSAALEMAFAVLWNRLAGLEIPNQKLALLAQKCENKYVGVNSGIMDQMASAMGREGRAMFLDTRSLEIEYAPVPGELTVVLCDTKKPRALTASAYNERRSQCEAAAAAIGVKSLRDATLQDLEAASMDEVIFRRGRHVITENQRCIEFRGALASSDLESIGTLMRQSHESLRDDYEVSCPELDAMAESAWKAPGCVGARMTGAGFGGACVALVEQSSLLAFEASVLAGYHSRTGMTGSVLACSIAEGARCW